MVMIGYARATAHPNLALIKYWGNRDDSLRLPANASISINLDGLRTVTEVAWYAPDGKPDSLLLNGTAASGEVLARCIRHLDALRARTSVQGRAIVRSENNFPTGTGIASSASGFAALAAATCAAAGVDADERMLSTLARLGSGSAARSIPPGLVEWYAADRHEDSFAESVASPEHWNLVDMVAIVSTAHKQVGSSAGHASAGTSPYQTARVESAPERLARCKRAFLERDFATLADVVELDSTMMHAVMMTSTPPLFYWQPTTLLIIELVRQWRADGLRVCSTLDAGPNVHCLCIGEDVDEVRKRLSTVSGVLDIRTSAIGGGVRVEPLTPVSR